MFLHGVFGIILSRFRIGRIYLAPDKSYTLFVTLCVIYSYMTENNTIHDELCRRADFSLRISERISSID